MASHATINISKNQNKLHHFSTCRLVLVNRCIPNNNVNPRFQNAEAKDIHIRKKAYPWQTMQQAIFQHSRKGYITLLFLLDPNPHEAKGDATKNICAHALK